MGLLDKFKSVLGLNDKKPIEEEKKSPIISEAISPLVVPVQIIKPSTIDDSSINRKNHRKSILLRSK